MAIDYSERIPNNVNLDLIEQGGDAPLLIPQVSLL